MKTRNIIQSLLDIPPYSLTQLEKFNILLPRLVDLTIHHYERCAIYRNILDRVFGGTSAFKFERIDDAPFLPIALFKSQELRSVASDEIIKTITSSGTTGQAVSKIYLDQVTAGIQAKVLVKIVQHFVGKDRLPMVILDHASVIRDRQSYSARGAGILGMIQFGIQPFYALSEDMSLDLDGLMAYLNKNQHKKILFFGFTFMVWQYFVIALEQLGARLTINDGILIHSGGWKKINDLAVDADEFQRRIKVATGIQKCINFYGMVEQVGSVYFENNLHFLHAPIYSEIIIRDPITLKPLPNNQPGLVQVISMLPTSYPGHSILTEDLGIIRGEDTPSLAMKGRYFEILGRVPKAELRGCSDTFQEYV